ncbi:transcription termination/antitermination protein NusG [Tessaracoccus antarcticus]|uniref:Transcription termination/antitermination protein NusG n=1 Tax=Tessaracoccus antarcticus TaxID=2479848 RepID=A0A3M0G2B1_9ACTN|nr:transcription termination/antitermination protein NusG [Tessaracoccus antarcticus]RMB58257.1 transcription termination/antitermination protein NusG [Tessaracoccus antarcticus]
MSETTNPADDFEIDLGGPVEPETTTDDVEIDLSGPLSDDEPEALPELADLEEEPKDEDDDEDDATDIAIEALRQELEAKFGEWYVIHTYSGMENRVKQNVDARAQSLDMEEYIFETIVPTEDVVEMRNNTRKTVTRCVLPGYVLVRMELTDESWGVVRHTPSVTGFVGHGQTPVPLSVEEVLHMLTPSVVARVAAETSGTSGRQRDKKVEVLDFEIGDSIMVADGPFAGMHATITEINPKTARLKALVDFMGRETPLDLEFKQVEKVV